jgi:hypothetical protein
MTLNIRLVPGETRFVGALSTSKRSIKGMGIDLVGWDTGAKFA